MLKEIAEQPAALERTIASEREKIARLARSLTSRDIDLIVLVARGSSDNAALFGRYLPAFPSHFRPHQFIRFITRS
jgi:glucosamine--fructose-6-phosphate aminotransferase (isomerizing)